LRFLFCTIWTVQTDLIQKLFLLIRWSVDRWSCKAWTFSVTKRSSVLTVFESPQIKTVMKWSRNVRARTQERFGKNSGKSSRYVHGTFTFTLQNRKNNCLVDPWGLSYNWLILMFSLFDRSLYQANFTLNLTVISLLFSI